MKKVLLLLTIVLGCATPLDDEIQDNVPAELWVCYNPESEYHGSECSDECYYAGFRKSENSFCWLLQRTECVGPFEYAWQRENCHLFGDMAE